jgi:hypothetical protein
MESRIALLASLSLAFSISACDTKKEGGGGAIVPSASGTASAAPMATLAASGKPAATGTGEAKTAGKASSFAGEYKATAGTLYVPETDQFKGFKYRGDKGEQGLGDGKLTLTSGENDSVEGEGDGALGKIKLKGLFRDGVLTANIVPAGGEPEGFSGFLHAVEKDGAVTGTMKLASSMKGNILREAAVTLKRK